MKPLIKPKMKMLIGLLKEVLVDAVLIYLMISCLLTLLDVMFGKDCKACEMPFPEIKDRDSFINSNQKAIVTIRGVRINDIFDLNQISSSKLNKISRIQEIKKKWESNPPKEIDGKTDAYTDEYYYDEGNELQWNTQPTKQQEEINNEKIKNNDAENNQIKKTEFKQNEVVDDQVKNKIDKFRLDPSIGTYIFDIELNKPILLFHFKFIGVYNIKILSAVENLQLDTTKIKLIFWNRYRVISEYSYRERTLYVEFLNLELDEEHGINATYSSVTNTKKIVQIKIKSDIQAQIKKKNLKIPMCPSV